MVNWLKYYNRNMMKRKKTLKLNNIIDYQYYKLKMMY